MKHKVEIINHGATDTLSKTIVLAAGMLSVGGVVNAQTVKIESGDIIVTVGGDEVTLTGLADSKATDIKVPKSVTFGTTELVITGVSANVFKGNTTIKSVTFADDSQITSIPDECFMGCTSLSSVSLPSSVSKLGNKAFYGCTSLVVPLSSGLEEIGDYAFVQCKAYNGDIRIPAKVSHIGVGAFRDMESLELFAIDEGNTVLKELPNECLYGCNIYSLRLTDNIEKIGDNFLTTTLKSRVVYPNSGELVLPRNLKEIGENAFPLVSKALFRIVSN